MRSIPLGEQPRRIVHAGEARAFALLTTSMGESACGEEIETCHLRLLDDQVRAYDAMSMLHIEECLLLIVLAN